MALEASEGSSFDRDFEFDAPQWIDFAYEKDHLEDESIKYDFLLSAVELTIVAAVWNMHKISLTFFR